ncbi:BrnT family toxin [Aureimonas leprariae]
MRNIRNHEGLDFADLSPDFFQSSIVVAAKRGRLKAIGPFGDTLLSVIFTPLGAEAVSVISMRRASRNERRLL